MRFIIFFSLSAFVCQQIIVCQDGLIIQENSLGVCTMDGIVESSASGYTGTGYANIDNGTGIGMSWSFTVTDAGEYPIYWRYALGGSDITSRDAKILVNNFDVGDTVLFPHSGSSSWEEWLNTDTLTLSLEAGYNKINLISVTEKGLPNIDYFHILESGAEASECLPSYAFSIDVNDPLAGTVDYTPKQELYDRGSVIGITAEANPGYFFHSWSGEAADINPDHSFTIQGNTHMTALFYPDGTTGNAEAIGYATVQHDNGTPYLLNGGAAGETFQAATLAELKYHLSSDDACVVELGTTIEGDNSEEINIRSNKTLVGTNESAHIRGIPVKIDGARNIIIRNITFSEVVRYDELEINGGAMNIWIDHCNFYTDRDHPTDYYDGLLDIKNRSRFITVSWSQFHDHQKTILISSGDQEFPDSVIRVTFHHNYFYDCDSRLPSIRFGKSHIFNNFYRDIGTGINSRMGACVRVENNYFLNAGTAVGMMYSTEQGAAELIGNIFDNSGYSDEPTCALEIPYPYQEYLDDAESIPDVVPGGAGGPSYPDGLAEIQKTDLKIFPNPSTGKVIVEMQDDLHRISQLHIINLEGQVVYHDRNIRMENSRLLLDLSHLHSGLYMLQIVLTDKVIESKILIRQ